MARTASVRNHSVIASLVAHFASAPIAEAEQGLEIISAVVAQRKGSLGAKRGPKPGGAAAAGASGTAAQAAGPQPVAPVKRKRIRNRSKAAKAAAAAAAGGSTATQATSAASEAAAPAASDVAGTQPLPDQVAGDQ